MIGAPPVAEPVRIGSDGCVAVPAIPGLGAALDEEKLSHYAIA